MRITLIVGLPGSGKSTFAKTLNADEIIDDPKDIIDVIGYDFVDNLVITDPYFCDSKVLEKAKKTLKEFYEDSEIEIIYFENNPEQCKKNAKLRPDKKVDKLIDLLSKIYNPPETAMKVENHENSEIE